MNRLIAAIAQFTSADPGLAARNALRSIVVLGLVGMFLATFWVLSITGIVLLLGRSIGFVPAVLIVGLFALLSGGGLLWWLGARRRTERKIRQARAEARQSAIAAALAVLPRNKKSRTVVVLAGLAALAFLVGTSGTRPDDEP